MEVISWEGNSCAVRLAVRLACWGREEGARSVGQTRRLASRQRARHGRRYAATVCSAAGGRGAQSTRALLVCPPAIHVCPAPAIHVCPPAQSRIGGDKRCPPPAIHVCPPPAIHICPPPAIHFWPPAQSLTGGDQRSCRGRGGRVCGGGCSGGCGGGAVGGAVRCAVGCALGVSREVRCSREQYIVHQTQTDGRRRRDSTSQSPHEIH